MNYVLMIAMVLSMATSAHAGTWCIYNETSGEVYSLSSQDDAVMPQEPGYKKTVIKDDMRDLDLVYPHRMYKFNGTRLVPNIKKLDELALQEERAREKAEQEKLIQAEIRKMALERLKAQNITVEE
jgi:hypothetical protein